MVQDGIGTSQVFIASKCKHSVQVRSEYPSINIQKGTEHCPCIVDAKNCDFHSYMKYQRDI